MNPAPQQLPDLIVIPVASAVPQPPAPNPGQPAVANPGQPAAANPGQPPVNNPGQPVSDLPSNVPVYVVTDMNATGFTFPKIKCPLTMSSTGVAAPQPSQPQPVAMATRTWKRAEVYYSNDGPFPGGQSSGTIVYFDPSKMV